MIKKIGIYYASTYGQTRKIAEFLGDWLGDLGAQVRVMNLRVPSEIEAISGFDGVLIGAPMHRCSYSGVVRKFVKDHRVDLINGKSSGFFSVCLTVTPGTPESYAEALGPLRDFLDSVSWTPQWITSFPGSVNYPKYNPLLRWIMRRICQQEGGPTDTTHDHELTRWDEVALFAQDFYDQAASTSSRSDSVSFATRTLNALMPEFEQRLVQQIAVNATPDEVRAAIENLSLHDMPLAGILVKIRDLGRKTDVPAATFPEAAEALGMLSINSAQAHELAGGLIGQFWKRDYGIRRVRNLEEFAKFDDPACTKTLSNFWFDYVRDGKTILHTETRIHSLGPIARRDFHIYWTVVSLGVRLYMASVLRGIRKSATRRHLQHTAVAA